MGYELTRLRMIRRKEVERLEAAKLIDPGSTVSKDLEENNLKIDLIIKELEGKKR